MSTETNLSGRGHNNDNGWDEFVARASRTHEQNPENRPGRTMEIFAPGANLFPEQVIEDLCALSRQRDTEVNEGLQGQVPTLTPFGSSVNVLCNLHGVHLYIAPYSDPETIMQAWQNAVLGNYRDFITIQGRQHPIVVPAGGEYPTPVDPGTNGEGESIAFMAERYVALRNRFAEKPCQPFPDWPSGDTCGTNKIARPDEGEREDTLDKMFAIFWMKLIHKAIEGSNGEQTIEDVAMDTLRESGLYYREWFHKDRGAPIQNFLNANEGLRDWPHTPGLLSWLRNEIFPVEDLPPLPKAAR